MRMGGRGVGCDNNDNVAFFREINYTKISVCKGARGGIITRALRALVKFTFLSLLVLLCFFHIFIIIVNNSWGRLKGEEEEDFVYIRVYIRESRYIYLYIGTKNIESIKTRFIISIFFSFFKKDIRIILSICFISLTVFFR